MENPKSNFPEAGSFAALLAADHEAGQLPNGRLDPKAVEIYRKYGLLKLAEKMERRHRKLSPEEWQELRERTKNILKDEDYEAGNTPNNVFSHLWENGD